MREGVAIQFGNLARFGVSRVKRSASLWARTQKIAVARLRHPVRPREMSVMDHAGAFRFAIWIQAEYDSDRLPPVSAFLVRVQEPQIGREMALVIGRQLRALWRAVFEGGDRHHAGASTAQRFVNMRLGDVTIPDPLMRLMHRGERRKASGDKSDLSQRSPQKSG